MDTEKHLFPESVKSAGRTLVPVLAYLATMGCQTLPPDSTLVLRDGVLYVCVDASNEDRCYKAPASQQVPNGDKTPE